MSLFSAKNLAKDRMAICESCNHFRKRTRTCGTPIKGNKVGSKRLCGCFMDIKSTLQFASCPLGKWKELQISHEEYLEIKELLDATKLRITPLQQEKVRHYSEKYLGLRVSSSSCTPCVAKNVKRLEQIINEYEK